MVCPILTAAEGFILGVGAKMFTIAGPVIVYGMVACVGLFIGLQHCFNCRECIYAFRERTEKAFLIQKKA